MGRRFDEAFERLVGEAAVHVREGRLEPAAAAYRKALQYRPNEWIVLAHLGACERFRGQYDAAERALLRALLVRPEEPGTLNELALVMAAAGRRADAIAYLERATRAAPAFLQGWCNLARLAYVDLLDGARGGELPQAARDRVIGYMDRILALDGSQAEFGHLRAALAGATVAAPPEGYVAAFFDRFAAGYDDKLAGRLKYSAPQSAAEFLRPWLGQRGGLRIVDLGCGTGLSGLAFKAHATRLEGVDASAAMLDKARGLGIYDGLHHAELIPFLEGQPAGCADLVLALDVFVYVGELRGVFAQVARVMAPDARFAFTVETLQEPGFALRPSGRFAHSRAYVETLAAGCSLAVTDSREFDVREEAGQPVRATLFALAAL